MRRRDKSACEGCSWIRRWSRDWPDNVVCDLLEEDVCKAGGVGGGGGRMMFSRADQKAKGTDDDVGVADVLSVMAFLGCCEYSHYICIWLKKINYFKNYICTLKDLRGFD